MDHRSRRDLLKTGLAAALAGAGGLPLVTVRAGAFSDRFQPYQVHVSAPRDGT